MFIGIDPAIQRINASYDVPDSTPICNLGAPKELVVRSLRPSNVISRDYA